MKNLKRHAAFIHSAVGKKAKPIASLLLLALAILLFLSILRASLFTEVDENKRVWFEVSFLLLSAVLASLLVSFLRQPFVMSLIIVGVLISPSFISMAWPAFSSSANSVLSAFSLSLPQTPPHVVSAGEIVNIFAQLGAIFLLFKIGMHSEIGKVFTVKNFAIALVGVALPFAAGYLFGMQWGYSPVVSMFFGAALTATSIGVSVAILEEFRVIDQNFAKVLLGSAVIDDILGLLALSLVLNFSTAKAFTIEPILNTAAVAFVFIAGGALLGRFVVKNYFDRLYKKELSPTVFLGGLAFLLFYAYTAEMIGLSSIVGAFLAGLALNYSRMKEKLLEAISPLEGLFTPIFFISLGILIDVNALLSFAVPILLLTILAVLTKLVGCGISSLALGLNKIESLLVGIGMVPRGEVAFIIALYGLTLKVLTPAEYSIITAMAFLTTAITPMLLSKALKARP